eukprot:scaffold1934_cov79-Cylindrotheca_fusiformis.AAC.13
MTTLAMSRYPSLQKQQQQRRMSLNNNDDDDKNEENDDSSSTQQEAATPSVVSSETAIMVDTTTTTSTGVDTRDTTLGMLLRGIFQNNKNDNDILGIDSVIVAKADLPHLKIWRDQSYQIKSIYWQSNNVNNDSNENKDGSDVIVKQIPQTTVASSIPSGYTQYLTVYNPSYHNHDQQPKPVIVTVEELGGGDGGSSLVSLQTEIFDSILFALPMVGFWTALCIVFANMYNDRYGGTFFDAFWGR